MTKRRNTKRALLSSVVALLLCFSMLLGSTFAWFTDSAVSGSNVITAGNLDIVVEYSLDGKEWENLDGATDLFQKGLWEPGHTEVVALRIKNNGSLALKYAANMNIVNETIGKTKDDADIKLSDILTVSTLTIQADTATEDTLVDWVASMALDKAFEKDDTDLAFGDPVAFNAGNVLELDQELYAGDSQYVFVKVDMAETVGNEANHDGTHVPTINFGINVFATQFTYEEDSFGNDYDADAEYDNPADLGYDVVYIRNLDDFTAFGTAVNNNATYGGVNVANNNKVWVEVMADIDMTNAPGIQGGQFAIGNGSANSFCGVFDGNGHTISNYTISAGWQYYVALFRTVAGNFTMKDITFDNCSGAKTNNRYSSILVGCVGGGTVTFDNVDIKNASSAGVIGAAAYVGGMTEGALYFIDCDADNVILTSSAEDGCNAMFLHNGWSHHDYEESGVWVENCTITNSKSIVNNVEDAAVAEYNYTK